MYLYAVPQAWCSNIAVEHKNNLPCILNIIGLDASGLVINKS